MKRVLVVEEPTTLHTIAYFVTSLHKIAVCYPTAQYVPISLIGPPEDPQETFYGAGQLSRRAIELTLLFINVL